MRMRVSAADVGGILGRVNGAKKAAMFVTAENVMSDCTPKVPKLSGDLRDSARAHVHEDGTGEVEWGTDKDTAKYARYQHDHDFQHYTTPETGGHWTDETKKERGEAWAAMYGYVFGRGLHG